MYQNKTNSSLFSTIKIHLIKSLIKLPNRAHTPSQRELRTLYLQLQHSQFQIQEVQLDFEPIVVWF